MLLRVPDGLSNPNAEASDPVAKWLEGLHEDTRRGISKNDELLLRCLLSAVITDYVAKCHAALNLGYLTPAEIGELREILEQATSGTMIMEPHMTNAHRLLSRLPIP